jgi:hypothetical protein
MKKRPESNWLAHSFRAPRRFRPGFKPGEEAVVNAMRRNMRLRKLDDDTVRAEGRAAGASERCIASYLDWRRAHAA